MHSGPAGPSCCGRCGGAETAARIARRQRFRAAVFPRPGGELSRPEGTGGNGPGGDGPPGLVRTVIGTLADVSPRVLVIASGDGERRLALAAGISIWRGGPAGATQLRPGEQVIARLAPGRRDVAAKVWASIGRVAGTIAEQDSGRLVVDVGKTRKRQEVTISPRAANRIQVRFPRLGQGNLIDVIGLRRGTALEALMPATSQPAYYAPTAARRPAPARAPAGTFSGSATWHEPDEPGEEPTGLAYPSIDPAAGCAEAGQAGQARQAGRAHPAALPYLAVGSTLFIRNECTGAGQVLPVTGCGAVARLFHDRCLTCGTSPRGRVADLTLASFAELGGELERGCFNATIAVPP